MEYVLKSQINVLVQFSVMEEAKGSVLKRQLNNICKCPLILSYGVHRNTYKVVYMPLSHDTTTTMMTIRVT